MKVRSPASLRLLVALGVVVTLGLLTVPVVAHGLLESATPAPDARVQQPPRLVSVTLTQPPLPNGRLIVRDGCNRVVSTDATVREHTISVPVTNAQPGEWRIRFDFVSATDGHRYAQSYGFSVAGQQDCSPDTKPSEPPAPPEEMEDEEMGGRAGAPHPSPGKPIPVTALVAASGFALAIGVTARLRPRAR